MQTFRIFSAYWKNNRSASSFNLIKRFCTKRSKKPGGQKLVHVQTSEPVASTSWRSYYILAGVGLGGFGGLAFFLKHNDEIRAIPKGQDVNCGRCSNEGPIIGGPFSLVDTEGRRVTEQNFLGNWVLLYFGHTSSPDVGPEEVQKMSKTIDILGSKHGRKIIPVFVTLDPQRDTPSHLCAYIREIDPRIVGLTGPVQSVRQMAQEYRVFFRKVDEEGGDYLVESSHNMYLMNPKMEVVRCFGVEYNAEDLAEAIDTEGKKVRIS